MASPPLAPVGVCACVWVCMEERDRQAEKSERDRASEREKYRGSARSTEREKERGREGERERRGERARERERVTESVCVASV